MSQAGSTSSSGGGGGGELNTLTGNTGGAISPSAGNINIVGDGISIEVTGDNGTATLTISNLSAVYAQKLVNVGPLADYSTGPTYYASFPHGITFTGTTRIVRITITPGNLSNNIWWTGPYDPYQVGLPGDPLPPGLTSVFTDLLPYFINNTDIVINVNAADLSLFTACYFLIDYIP